MKRGVVLLCLVGLVAGCTGSPPEIRAVCERQGVGEYVLKWESSASLRGKVKIYVSEDAEGFGVGRRASLEVNVSEWGARYLCGGDKKRKYFRLEFVGDQGSMVVGERSLEMDSVPNLRDMGGYYTAGRKWVTRWGQVYRSGSLRWMSEADSVRLSQLGLKTVIDLRSVSEMSESPVKLGGARIVRIPLTINTMEGVSERLTDDQLHSGDAMVYMEETYVRLVSENKEALVSALKEFEVKENYPILVSCTFGKDACGVLTWLLLTSVGVPLGTILEDYKGSGLTFEYIVPYLETPAESLTLKAKEAAVVLLSAEERFYELATEGIGGAGGAVDQNKIKSNLLTRGY
jgi:protein-tyrosine phosphatase